MKGTFSESAQFMLQQAREWARELQHEEAEPEHLLLALLSEPTDEIREVFQSIPAAGKKGVPPAPQQLAGRLREQLPAGRGPVFRGKIPLSPKTQTVVEMAGQMAAGQTGGVIEPLHLLLSLIKLQSGPIAQFLRHYGLSQGILKGVSVDISKDISETKLPERLEGRPAAGETGHLPGAQPAEPEAEKGERETLPVADRSSVFAAKSDEETAESDRPIITVVEELSGLTYREFPRDARLYLPRHEGWQAHIKRGWQKEYCYFKNPGEDYFHLLISGEIYLQRGEEKYCLNCALRHGLLTRDRLYWQRLPERRHLRQFPPPEQLPPEQEKP